MVAEPSGSKCGITELRAGDGVRAGQGATGARDPLLRAGGSCVPSDGGDGCHGHQRYQQSGAGEVGAALVSFAAGAWAPCSG